MSRRLVPILLGIIVGVSFLNLGLPSAQAACPFCRAYAVVWRDDTKNYTAIHAYITYGIPTIRDGGFSSEVIWVPNPNGGNDYIEMGWRRTTTGTPIIYWLYYDTNHNLHMTNLGTNTTGHDYQIEHFQSDLDF